MTRFKAFHFSWLGPEHFRLLLGPTGFNWYFSFAPDFQWCSLAVQGSPAVTLHLVSAESSSLILHSTLSDD